METILLAIIIFLLVVNTILLLKKGQGNIDINSLKTELIKTEAGISNINSLIREEFGRSREELNNQNSGNRKELQDSLKDFGESFTNNVKEFNSLQKEKFADLLKKQDEIKGDTESKLERIRDMVEKKIKELQDENAKKLEEMRATVDEKLQATLEKRFNDSFKLISERLEQVHKGLGEMQSLATGVGDLKKVLTNVKTRGNLGEIQLGAILEEILSPDQYERNAVVKEGSLERVEFAVKLPNKNDDRPLYISIDSKFPIEDYQRLLEAYENSGDVETASKLFEASIKKCAKDIKDKYINPPVTTDFAIMFVPTEGLYAEILRRTGFFEMLQKEFKVVVVGPTNLVAFLSSLQMGFRTLAIEKRSSEVWQLLGAIKTEFGKFGDVLEKTKKKLQEASNVIDLAGTRSRAIERKLKTVDALPQDDTLNLLGPTIEVEQEEA